MASSSDVPERDVAEHPHKEARDGYKWTDAGIIPVEWMEMTLEELFSFKNGLNKAKRYFGNGAPIVNYMDVYEHPGLRCTDLEGRVDVTAAEVERFSVRRGDVFFTRTSETVEEVGTSAVMLDQPRETVFSGFLLRARPKNGALLDDFKKYCLSTPAVRAQITSKSTYTTRALTNGRSLGSVHIAVPPLAEQRAIAEALSDVDDLLGALNRLIAKKRAIMKGAMQRLLSGNMRLPGFEDAWEVKRVSELGEVVTGGTPRTNNTDYWGGAYPWITPTDISERMNMTSSERGLTGKGLGTVKRLPAGTVLVTCIASIGKNAILRTTGACNQQINAVIPNAGSNPEFLYFMFEASTYHLLANAGITATRIISKARFSELVFELPPLREQAAIAAVLVDMDGEIEALEQVRDKARMARQGMLQQLLTGRTRMTKRSE